MGTAGRIGLIAVNEEHSFRIWGIMDQSNPRAKPVMNHIKKILCTLILVTELFGQHKEPTTRAESGYSFYRKTDEVPKCYAKLA